MVDLKNILPRLVLFITGGLIALLLKPFITLILLLAVIGIVVIVLTSFIPGGWIISYLGGKLTSILIFSRIGVGLILLILGAVGAMALGDWILFASGGLAMIILVKPPSIMIRRSGKAQRSQEVVGRVKSGKILGKVLSLNCLESGILVTGEEAVDVGRLLIYEVRKLGRKVIVIGESSKLIPEGSGKIKASRADSFNIVEDLLSRPEVAEAFTYSFVLANKLENDDIPLILVATYNVVKDALAGGISRNDLIKAIPDQIQDKRGNLIKNILSLCSFIGSRGLSFTSLGNDWDILYISVKNLPQRQAVFTMAYSLFMLRRYDAVLVLHNPEKLLPDINLLPYNARESWERVFNIISLWRDKGLGLILISRSPIISTQLLRLCPVAVATRMPEVPARLEDEYMRSLVKIARTVKPGELVTTLMDKTQIVKYNAPKPANVPPPKPLETVQEIVAAPVVGSGIVESEKEHGEAVKAQPTQLEKEFSDKVVEVARILEKAKSGLPVNIQTSSEVDVELVKNLEMKGYLTQFGGVYYPSATGLELLNEYQKAVKERGLLKIQTIGKDEPQEKTLEKPVEVKQTVIDHEEALDRLGENAAGYYLAESLFRQGKYAQSVMKAYEFMVNALKSFYNIEKGHLDDIIEMLEPRGIKPLTINEAKDAKTLLIEASNALKDGRQVGLTSAQRMLKYSRKVLEFLSGGREDEG